MTDVALRFGATDTGLDAQFRRVGGELEKVERTAQRVGQGAVSAFRGIQTAIAGVAAAGLTKIIVDLTQYADELDKAAAQTGVTIEALQRLRFVGDQVGVGAESITRAISKLQVSLVSADEGSKEAAKGLATLGLSAGALINLAPDEAFDRIAVSIAAIENPTERTAAAVAVFGKAGAELVPILSRSSAELAAARAQFEALGGPVADATVKSVDNIGDAFGELKLTVKNLGVEILGLVSGPFANLFRATAEGFGSVRIALSGTELEKVKRGIEFLEAERNSGLPFVLEAGKSPFNPGGHVGVLGPEGIDARLKELRARQTQLEAALQVQEVVTTARRFPVPPGAPSGKGVGKSRATSGALGGSAVGLDSADNLANITLQFEGYSRAQQEFREQNLQDLQRYSDDLLAINLATEEQRVADTIDVEERIYDLKAGAIDAAGDLLSLLAVKSRTAAIALIAINKAAAISQIIQATALAAAKGIAIFGPTPAGFAAAAAAKAFGALQIGLVAATGALQIGSLSGDSGRGGASGGARSVTPGDDDRPVAAGASPLTATNIYISGYIGEAQVRQMVEALERKFAQDVVIISANSRQAIELRRD